MIMVGNGYRHCIEILCFFILFSCCLPFVAYGVEIPRLQGYVNDYDIQVRTGAGTLYGIYNTSSYDIQLLDNGSYIFILQYPLTGSQQLDEPDAAATAFLRRSGKTGKVCS
jgi:hypothetical protein